MTERRRRAEDPDEFDPTPVRGRANGWAARIQALRQFANEPGGVAFLVLAFVLGAWTGWIPSPLTRMGEALAAHDLRLATAVTRWVENDVKLTDALIRLTRAVESQGRRDALRECAEIKDLDLRRRCLD